MQITSKTAHFQQYDSSNRASCQQDRAIDVGDSFFDRSGDRICDSFCDSDFRSSPHHDSIHLTIWSTYSVHVYAQENTTGWGVGLAGILKVQANPLPPPH